MGTIKNIFEKTAQLLKENELTLDVLTPQVVEDINEMTKSHTDNSPTNIKEQDEPIDTQGGEIVRGDEDNDFNAAANAEELEKRRTYDDLSDEEKREVDNEQVDTTPFKPMEVKILKTLHKYLDKSELQKLSDETPENYGSLDNKFWDIMKLFGISVGTSEENTRVSRYAKWTLDNWNEEGDYNIEDPIKVPLKWYDVHRDESGSQIEYKSGQTEVLGFDEDDAGERADYDFYAWGGEMETMDYGDYEHYDSEITQSSFSRMDENTKLSDLRTKALISIGGIQRDKLTSPDFIKNILNSSGHKAMSSGLEDDGDDYNSFYTPGTDINLDADLQRVRDRIRFEEYGDSFKRGVETRGSAFEGMLAGLFNGKTIPGNPKEDIEVEGEYYSVKQANPGDAWDTGSLMIGYDFAVENMLRDNFSEEEIPPTPVDLMVAGDDYIQYKAQMLTESFKTSEGVPLKWIFAHVLDGKHIEYDVMDSEELISAILSSDCSQGTKSQSCAVGQSRKSDTGLRIKSRFVLGNPKMITFPTVSEEDIRSIIYDPEGDRVEDKIRRIFKNPNKVSQYTVDYIRDNPKEFLLAVNRELPNLTKEEKNLAYNLLVEQSDIFGQGLSEPIEPEDFDGNEEEWEELVDNVEDDKYEDEKEIYTGGKTDPEKGFVAPSKEVTNNICNVEGFCQEQGPITFGQLKALVEKATTQRIKADIGRGVFKSLWRLVPFFIPQILLAAVGVTATRAINKIITPALKDTGGYKSWWGKAVLKAMDVAEGDYIPDVALGDDPLSKVFFISDGLMSMIKDKYKLKFARYVSEVASNEPDNKPVPEWFVENLLRDYLNQKFLLSPPLPVKYNIDTKEQIEESKNPFGLLGDDWKEQIINHEKNLSTNELKYKKLADQLDGMTITIPININDGNEPLIGTTDIIFTIRKPYIFQGLRGDFFDNLTPRNPDVSYHGKEDENKPIPTVIKYDLVFRSVEPGSLLEELLEDNSIEGREGLDARERLMELLMQEWQLADINEFLMKEYFKLYGIQIGRMGNMYDSRELNEQEHLQKGEFSVQTHNTHAETNWEKNRDDTKLNVESEVLISYLNKIHRANLKKEFTTILDCLEYNCYDDEDFTEEPDEHMCVECTDALNDELEKLDKDLVKLGFVQEHDNPDYDDDHRITWLEKPFPYSYNLWVDGLLKEINPRFYVNDYDNVSYLWSDGTSSQIIGEQFNTWHENDTEEDQIKNTEILFNYWSKFGPTMDRNALKLIGFDTHVTVDHDIVWDNLKEYYGYEELNRIIYDRLEGQHDSWEYEYIITSFQPFTEDDNDVHLEIMVNGDVLIPMSTEAGPVVEMTLWEINEASANQRDETEISFNFYEDVYDEVESVIFQDIQRVLLLDLPVDTVLEYMDISEPGEFEDRVKSNKVKIINEQTQPGLSPELEIGDEILVVDADKERENGKTQYTTPGEQDRPEKFVPYTVVDKESNGSQSKWSWKYTLVPPHVLQEYEKSLKRGWGNYEGYEKLLYPWIYEWIFATTPTANSVDRLTLNEHNQSGLNPELRVDDIVRVIDVDGEHGRMPERFGIYRVVKVGKTFPLMAMRNRGNANEYYDIEPYPNSSTQFSELDTKTIYRGDNWIKVDSGRNATSKVLEEDEDGYIDDMVYRDQPRDKHTRRMNKDLGNLKGFPLERYMNMPPPENESDKTEEEIGYLEEIPVDKNLVGSADEIRKHFNSFLLPKGLEYPKEELKEVMVGVKAIILKLKYHYNRPRPWQIAQAKGLELNSETLKSSSSPSYPSGHATQGRFIGKYLAELYPEYAQELIQIGEDIAFSRNMAKVHYPSDSGFGKLLADDMYDYVYNKETEPELQEQYDRMTPLESKKLDTTGQLFKILDDNFAIEPHPRGEITYDGQQMALYSHIQNQFVPIAELYDAIDGMNEAGLQKDDIQIFIEIVTEWVNSRMVVKPELYESLVDTTKENISPDLKIGDRIYVWDVEINDAFATLPSNSVAVVVDGPFQGQDITYEVKDEVSGERFGLYGKDEQDNYDKDKWVILPPKPLREGKRIPIQKVRLKRGVLDDAGRSVVYDV